MVLKDFLPSPAVREFVQCYRIVHFQFDKNVVAPFKPYSPKPEECLHFFIQEGEEVELLNSPKKNYESTIVLVGQQTFAMKRYPGKNLLSLQVVFQPTGLFRLTGIPSSELTNQYLDAEYIFPKSIWFVYERLQAAKDYKAMLVIAEEFMVNLISHSQKDIHPLDSVSKLMMLREGHLSMDWLAKESCLCPKQFKRKFNERVGVNPKTYARIIRFTKAVNIKNAYPSLDWLRIAVECGYYDYQHLVKDYKDFTGLTPHELQSFENNSPESRLGLTKELYSSRVKLLAV